MAVEVALNQALSFNLAELGWLIPVVFFAMLLVTLYLTITKKQVRNFYASNVGLYALVSILVWKSVGTMMIPSVVADIVSTALSMIVYPILSVAVGYGIYRLVAGTIVAIKS